MKKTVLKVYDDLTGVELQEGMGENIHFSLDDEEFEIDLSHDAAKEFRSMLQPYVAVAHRVSKGRGTASRSNAKAIRAWAKLHDIPVAPRGRLGREVLDAYDTRDKANP